MRRAERAVTDAAWCRGVLEKATYLVLALNDGGAPYAVPLCVALVGEGIYLHMATAGHKLDLLRNDPRAGFVTVGHAEVTPGETVCATGMRASSVAGTAICVVVSDPNERRRALDAFGRKYAGTVPVEYPPGTLAATVVVRLDPISLSGRRSG
jgi:nitroimidazol reductase NimA-like FMN-containing flavoprotein (pyridoxamine 5'-phosphate oxidase superfamily)